VLQQLGAVAEKLAVRGLVCPEPDVRTLDGWAVLAAVRWPLELAVLVQAVAALDIPAGDLSAARSFSAPGVADVAVALAPQIFELASHSAAFEHVPRELMVRRL
jgi:hypothetical protein